MISFSQFIESYKKKYICLVFDEETNAKLYDYACSNGFDLSTKFDGTQQDPRDFDFHLTVFYTNNENSLMNLDVECEDRLSVTGLDLFGKDHNVPVLRVKPSYRLKTIRSMLEDQGLKDSFPNYKPHVSLSYKKGKYPIDKMDLPDFELVTTKLMIRNQ